MAARRFLWTAALRTRLAAVPACPARYSGSYDFDLGKESGGYREFTTPYAGLSQVIKSDGLYQSQMRYGQRPPFGCHPWAARSATPSHAERGRGWRPGGRERASSESV
jgi:hypothetical protein